MRGLGPRGWEFKSLYPDQYASVAQLAERFTCNEDVVGSIPIGSSSIALLSDAIKTLMRKLQDVKKKDIL